MENLGRSSGANRFGRNFSRNLPIDDRRRTLPTRSLLNNFNITSSFVAAEKTPSQAAFSDELSRLGGCSIYLAILATLTLYTGVLHDIHYNLFFFQHPMKCRCEITELEPHYDYRQIVMLTQATVDNANPQLNLQYCGYYKWNFTSLIFEHGGNYTFMLEHVTNVDAIPEYVECESIVVEYVSPVTALADYFQFYEKLLRQHRFMCDYKLILKISGMAPVFISLVIVIPIGILGDIYGRKPIFLGTITIQAIGSIISCVPIIYCVLIGQAIFACVGKLPFLSLYTILSEHCNKPTRLYVVFLIFLEQGLAPLLLLVMCVSIRTWWYSYVTGTVAMSLCLFAAWYVSESPRWLFYSGRTEKAWKVLLANNKRVEKPSPELMKNDLKVTKVVEILRFYNKPYFKRRLMLTTVLMFMLWALAVTDYKPHHVIRMMRFGYFIATGIGHILCVLGMYVLLIYFGRRPILLTMIISATIVSIVIYMHNAKDAEWILVMIMILKVLCKGACSCLLFQIIELFPTRFRFTAVAVSVFGLKVARIFQFYYELFVTAKYHSISFIPMIVFAIASWLLTYFLLETANVDIPDLPREAVRY